MTQKVEQITFKGLKGANREVALNTRTFITGVNRGGKTTVRDALFLALSGRHPELPATNHGVMKLASGPELYVKATFTDGNTIERAWSIQKGGGIKGSTTGEAPTIDMVQLSPAIFMHLGGKDRLAYLAATASADLIRSILTRQFADSPKIMAIYDEGIDPFSAMDAIAKHIGERRRAAKQERDRTTKALQEHSTARPEITEAQIAMVGGNALQIAMNEVARLAADVDTARNEVSSMQHDMNTRSEAERERRDAAPPEAVIILSVEEITHLATLQRACNEGSAVADRRAEIKADIYRHELVVIGSEEAELLEEAIAEFKDDLDQEDLKDFTLRLANVQREEQEIKLEIGSFEKMIRKIQARAAIEPVCSHCGQEVDVETATQARDTEVNELAESIQASEIEMIEIMGRVKKNTEDLQAARERNTRRDDTTKDMRALEANTKARSILEGLYGELDDLPAAFSPAQFHELQRMSDKRDAADRAMRAREISEAQPPLPPCPTTAALQEAIGKRDRIKAAHEEAQHRCRRIEEADAVARTFQTWSSRLTEIGDSITEAEAQLAAVAATEAVFETAKGEMLGAVWMPIMATANRLLRNTFDTADLTADFDDTDIGVRDTVHGFRSYETLAGSEKAVLAFALGAAIATRQPIRLTILDELGSLDRATRGRFVQAVGDLTIGTEAVLDQVVIFDHDEESITEALHFAKFVTVRIEPDATE